MLPLALCIAGVLATGAAGSPLSDAQRYIKKHGADSCRVQATIMNVQVSAGLVQKSPTRARVHRLAIQARRAHAYLDRFRD
jgi:hypothetical protein